METPATTVKQQAAVLPTSQTWDDYFPVINKVIVFAILVLAVVFVTGVDITRLTGGISKTDANTSSIASLRSLPVLAGGFKGFDVTAKGGWKVIVGLIVALAAAAGVAFAVLSSSGLDAAWTKELEEKRKEKEKKLKPNAQAANAGGEEPECNLASYKMFFGPKEEPAPEAEAAEVK